MRLIHSITSLILLGFLALGSAHAQFEPVSCNGLPYNPDADCDGVIGTFDFLPFAALFGLEFTADFDSLTLPDYMDPDPTNELQWLAIDGDTLHLLLADSTIYSSVYIGGPDGADGADGVDGMNGADGADGVGRSGRNGRRRWCGRTQRLRSSGSQRAIPDQLKISSRVSSARMARMEKTARTEWTVQMVRTD